MSSLTGSPNGVYPTMTMNLPNFLNMYFFISCALKVSHLCRLCFTFALLKDEKQASALIFLDAAASTITELALALNSGALREHIFYAACSSGGGCIGGSLSDFSHKTTSTRPGSRSSRHTHMSSIRTFGSSFGSFKSLASRTDSFSPHPLDRFFGHRDYQREADIGRLVGEEFLQEDWERELLLASGSSRIGMTVRRPPSSSHTLTSMSRSLTF